jgi:hypothetical protein
MPRGPDPTAPDLQPYRAPAGGSYAGTGGGSCRYRVTSTSACWPVHPGARRDVPDVLGEHIRVAVHAHAVVVRRVPRTSRQLDDAAPHVGGRYKPGQATASVVIDLHHVAVAQAACCGVVGMDAQRLASPYLRRLAVRSVVKLAVQASRRVVGDQVQRIALGGR